MGNLRLYGSTSGYVEIAPPAVGGSQVLTLPTDSVQPGLVLVNKTDFSAVSSVSLNNVFSATYDNYLITITEVVGSTVARCRYRLRAAGVDASTSYYFGYFGVTSWATSTVVGSVDANQPYPQAGLVASASKSSAFVEVSSPFKVSVTSLTERVVDTRSSGGTSTFGGGFHDSATSFDGFTIFPSTGTFTGTVRVYGYRNS